MCEIPEWLRGGPRLIGELPLCELLRRSVYYPAAEFDGTPVEILSKELEMAMALCGRKSVAELDGSAIWQ